MLPDWTFIKSLNYNYIDESIYIEIFLDGGSCFIIYIIIKNLKVFLSAPEVRGQVNYWKNLVSIVAILLNFLIVIISSFLKLLLIVD